jgi:hypothetical protein
MSRTARTRAHARSDVVLALIAVYMFLTIIVAFAFESAIHVRFAMPSGEAYLYNLPQ